MPPAAAAAAGSGCHSRPRAPRNARFERRLCEESFLELDVGKVILIVKTRDGQLHTINAVYIGQWIILFVCTSLPKSSPTLQAKSDIFTSSDRATVALSEFIHKNQVRSKGGHMHCAQMATAATAPDNGRLTCCPTPKVSRRKIDSSYLSLSVPASHRLNLTYRL